MQAISRKSVRVARWVGLVLITSTAWTAPAAVAAPPQITVSPEPPTGWLSGGEYPIGATATSDEYEILALRWRLEGGPVVWSTDNCTPKLPCPNERSGTAMLRPADLPDGAWNLVVEATYWPVRMGNMLSSQEVTRRYQLLIDHSAPRPVTGLTLLGDDGWRSRNGFDVQWATPEPDRGTPHAGVDYRLCPSSNPAGSVDGCITGRRNGRDVRSIAGIVVPGTGAWRLELALRDELGHVDLDAGAKLPALRLDLDAPRLAFVARAPSDPARIQLSVADEGSGVASVAIEARRRGEDIWRALTVTRDGDRFAALLDDDNFPAGAYEVRGRAADAVGNEKTLVNGEGSIQLPVRQGSRLSAGTSTRVRGKRRTALDDSPSVRYGARVPIYGRVTDAFGRGRAMVQIEVSERLAFPGVGWRGITTLTTDKDGVFRFTAPKGVARTIRFRYGGAPTTRPAASEVTIRVRAASTLKPSRRTLRNGETVVLRGRLLGRPIPLSGKLVTVQAWTSHGWLTFGNARASSKDGRWSYRYTFTGTTRTSRYRFRAVVPLEDAYPYVRGTSPVRAVLVRAS